MKFLRPVLFFCFLIINIPVFAQLADTLQHADTPGVRKLQPIADDTTIDNAAPYIVTDTNNTPAPKAPAHKGYVINGKVADANNGEGIPFATVFFPRTSFGTAADLDGNFVIKMDKLPGDTLHLEAMGYKAVNKILRKGQHDYNFIIELERSTTSLNEVVVHAGEDPAVILMRHIIERKPYNNVDRIENYKYEAYNRLEADLQRLTKEQFAKIPILKSYAFIYENLDSQSEAKPYLPLYLTETISDYYFQSSPKKQREFIKASMIKGVNNEHVDKYLGTLYQNVNIYRNYIPVLDKKFVSPISDDGLFYYKYKIIDTEKAYGHNIILVQFKPRRPGENCFSGDFWVVDTAYAIQRMSMEVPKVANLNWVDKVSLYQEFAPVDSFWFCIKDKFVANFTVYNSKRIPGIIGRKTTTYHRIVINDPSISKVLQDPKYKEDIIKSDSSRKRSEEWWAASRPDSLSKNEKAIYKMVDTITKMPITTMYKNTITFLASGVKDFGPIQLGPYFYIYSRNPVEGHRFRFSAGTPRTIKNGHFTGYLAYGTRDERFKYGFTGLWLLNRSPRAYLYGSYVHDINSTINHAEQLANDNIFSTLFRKPHIPWKLAFADEIRLEVYKEYFSGFSHKLVFDRRIFTPYRPLPSTKIFRDSKGLPSNSAINSDVGIELRYAYKEKYLDGQYLRVNLSSKYPVLGLEVSAGFKDFLNGGYDYQKARFTITEHINVPPFGHIKYNFFAGKYFGTVPYALLKIHPGNEYYYYNQYAFAMMNTYEFLSDQYTGFNFEHNIGGGVFNYIPAIKKLKFRQFWTAKCVVGSLSEANKQLNLGKGYPFRTLEGHPYIEIGTGVSNIFELFRLDFVWRVTPKPLPSEAKARYFGVFGSVRFQF